MGIRLLTVSIFARITGTNRYFCGVAQQVLSKVVAVFSLAFTR